MHIFIMFTTMETCVVSPETLTPLVGVSRVSTKAPCTYEEKMIICACTGKLDFIVDGGLQQGPPGSMSVLYVVHGGWQW